MNDTTIIQIPVQTSVKTQATTAAKEMGFSSLQEMVRVMMSRVIAKQLTISFTPYPIIPLSLKNERRYNKILDDYRKGKNFVSFDNVKDAVAYLNEDQLSQKVR